MDALMKRLSGALLSGFGTFVLALPVACCGFVVYNEHVTGDVQSSGPEAILGAMAVAAVMACSVVAVVLVKTRQR